MVDFLAVVIDHVGESQEYVCPFGDCSRRYTSRSGFLNHQKKHTEMNKQMEPALIVPQQS